MFEVAERKPTTVPLDRVRPESPSETSVDDGSMPSQDVSAEKNHRTLMDCMQDEGERQAEERFQMAIDEDYNDHQHWRPEDAAVLQERGQAPLVFNEGRNTIEWISGTEKRMRKDFKALPREPDDEQGAELKTKLLKYTDDANMTQWHRSAAFKQMASCGLSWLEEGLNPDPESEIIYSGREDWRNVLRDSRGRDIMLRDWRYCFRKKRLDLDYATALLGGVAGNRIHLLKGDAYRQVEEPNEGDSVWYLGQKLTSASDIGGVWRKSTTFDERSAYMQSNGYYDSGRRLSIDLIEAWYRVPEAVQVFNGGMFDGKIYNDQDPRMRYAVKREGNSLRDAVRMRMRVMLCTEKTWLWDGPSPFSHGKFTLIPLIAYRRARDGMIYGVWRGMRDLSDDTNKRRAKALWALSANRVITDERNVTEDQDLDMIREEAARVDGVLVTKAGASLEIVENTSDIQGNLAMAQTNIEAMRNIGGVTSENLGHDTNATSGKAILAKQDQGSLTTSDLFDNYQLAIKMQGTLRLSHMEQFWTERKAIRIAGQGQPFDWIVINEFDPATGQFQNDITQRQADFEVDTQDFRSSASQAALEQMFNLLSSIATFAPDAVLSVLDLVVDASDVRNKPEWVARIRKINGQRDPSKAPTPEELAQDQAAAAKQAKAEATLELLGEAELMLKQASAKEKDAGATLKLVDAVMKRVGSMRAALDAGIIVTNAPQVVGAADAITSAAGLDEATPGADGKAALPIAAAGAPPVEQAALPAGMVPPEAMPPGAMPGEPQPAISMPPEATI
jgi:hypothetical protein